METVLKLKPMYAEFRSAVKLVLWIRVSIVEASVVLFCWAAVLLIVVTKLMTNKSVSPVHQSFFLILPSPSASYLFLYHVLLISPINLD